MLLCRSARLSAAARDHAFKSSSSFLAQVNARRLRQVTGVLRTGTHRCFCASALGTESTPAHLRTRQHRPELLLHIRGWDCGAVPSDWGHLDRVSAVASGLSERVQSGGGCLDVIRDWSGRHSKSRRELGGYALFTGTRGVSSPRRFTGDMQTRSASTAADKRRDTGGGEETPDREKELNLKEATSSTAQAAGEPKPQEGKLNKRQQLKKVFKEYGAVGVSFHIGISLMSLGMFYLLVSSGIDMTGLLCKLGFSESVVRSKMAAGTSTFVLAYAVHKLFAPLRISVTLVSVPLIVRYLRKTGLFKPPTPAP